MPPDDMDVSQSFGTSTSRLETSTRPRQNAVLIAISIVLRALLIGILLYAVTHQEMPQFHGKGMVWRLLLYPVVTLIVPAYWWFIARPRGRPYPFALDFLVIIPPLFDSLGNAFNMYDRATWWDDFNHFINPVFITIALGLLLIHVPLGRFSFALFIVGISTIFGVIWELAEYVSFVQRSPEFNTAYQDTMGDLALDLVGSALGASIVVVFFWPKQRANHTTDIS